MVIKPSPADHTETFDSNELGDDFVAVGRKCEVVAILVSAGGGSVACRLYDGSEDRVMIAANAGESTPFTPAQPMLFKNNVKVVFEQGGQSQGGGEITIVLN